MRIKIASYLLLCRFLLCTLCCGGVVIFIYLLKLRVSLMPLSNFEMERQNISLTETLSIQKKINIKEIRRKWHYRNETKFPTVNRKDALLLRNRKYAFDFRNISTTKNFNSDTRKEWYYRNGTKFPTVSTGDSQLFPDEKFGDRILEQLMYFPKNYQDSPKKIILAYNGLKSWYGSADKFSKCPVNKCLLTEDKNMTMEADAIIYKNFVLPSSLSKPANQVWVIFSMEPPYTSKIFKYPNVFNWTATYRRDSDLVEPYGLWNYYDSKVVQKIQPKNYAANKTKLVAWFASNCNSPSGRLAYALELAKYIQVDIYGECGPLKCPKANESACFKLLKRDYKFYLAFENSNCRDYITEKYFQNSLNNEVLPIVMGAPPEDYERIVPKNSYIHVDDFATPQDLANYLHRLDKDDELYNSYFKWKGTGEFIRTHFWCRLCALMHSPIKSRYYEDINKWWRAPGICQY